MFLDIAVGGTKYHIEDCIFDIEYDVSKNLANYKYQDILGTMDKSEYLSINHVYCLDSSTINNKYYVQKYSQERLYNDELLFQKGTFDKLWWNYNNGELDLSVEKIFR